MDSHKTVEFVKYQIYSNLPCAVCGQLTHGMVFRQVSDISSNALCKLDQNLEEEETPVESCISCHRAVLAVSLTGHWG